MTPLTVADSPSLKGPIEVLLLVKVTVEAGEPVEVQIREGEDPTVRLVMVGGAGGKH